MHRLANAFRHPLLWTAVGVLLAVLALLPANDRSPIDSPTSEDCGISILAPSVAKPVKLAAITKLHIAPLMGDAVAVTSRAVEPTSSPVDDRPPLLVPLRI